MGSTPVRTHADLFGDKTLALFAPLALLPASIACAHCARIVRWFSNSQLSETAQG
jgi:hypothetical protein